MVGNLFSIEIDLEKAPEINALSFNDKTVKDYLRSLKAFYSEVFILTVNHHVYFLVVGNAPLVLLNELYDFVTSTDALKISKSSRHASQVFKKIAQGSQWTDLSNTEIRRALEHAALLASQENCLGESLTSMIAQSFEINTKAAQYYRWLNPCDMSLLYPGIDEFDYEKLSLN